jgi:hypothetical protein
MGRLLGLDKITSMQCRQNKPKQLSNISSVIIHSSVIMIPNLGKQMSKGMSVTDSELAH